MDNDRSTETRDQNQSSVRRRRARRPLRKKRKIRVGRIILAIIAVVILVAGLVYGARLGYGYITQRMSQSTVSASEEGTTASGVMPSTTTETVNRLPTLPFRQESLDKPMYILVLGVDQTNNNMLESIFLASVNTEQKTVDIIGIPGNTKIDRRDKKGVDPLSSMYRDGKYDLPKAIVEDIFHITIPYVIILDQNAFNTAVNSVGDVRMYVERALQKSDSSGKDITLGQGFQSLAGEKSWTYFTYDADDESGVEKIQRQERFIKAIINEETNRWLVAKVFSVYRFWDTLTTNISTWDAMKFTATSSGWKTNNYHFYILPGTAETVDGVRYWTTDPIEAQRLVGITMNSEGLRTAGQTNAPSTSNIDTNKKN